MLFQFGNFRIGAKPDEHSKQHVIGSLLLVLVYHYLFGLSIWVSFGITVMLGFLWEVWDNYKTTNPLLPVWVREKPKAIQWLYKNTLVSDGWFDVLDLICDFGGAGLAMFIIEVIKKG